MGHTMVCKGWCRNEPPISRWTYVRGLNACTICEKSVSGYACYCCGHVTRRGAQTNTYRKKRIEMKVRH